MRRVARRDVTWGLVIGGLLLTSFCLGLPQFHYATALMVGAILRHKDTEGNLFDSHEGAVGRPTLLRVALLLVLVALFGASRAFAGEPQPEPKQPGPKSTHAEALKALHGEVWEAEVEGMRLMYHLVDMRGFPALGYALLEAKTQTCHIYVDIWLTRHDPRVLAEIALHEVGHCVDWLMLGLSHNNFSAEGCVYGAHYCEPAEGYAEAWRRAYTARCGADLASVGYAGADVSPPCALPDPQTVTPEHTLAYGQLEDRRARTP